jgi:hypothetical protein
MTSSKVYQQTTLSEDYEAWSWYQQMQSEMQERQNTDWSPRIDVPFSQPLPVEIGIEYCDWILQTAEVRDIIFRRFVEGDYENETEAMLLRASAFHFLHQKGYAVQHSSKLSGCWHDVAKLIVGDFGSTDAPELRQRLLRLKQFFFDKQMGDF